MSHLLYSSEEMYSSTELIRKSKTIFNKIINEEINKAIIMRDGKPSFMLLDFDKYEQIMVEYDKLKNTKKKKKSKINHKIEKKVEIEEPKAEELTSEMEVIEDFDFDDKFKQEVEKKVREKKKKQEIKEFWS